MRKQFKPIRLIYAFVMLICIACIVFYSKSLKDYFSKNGTQVSMDELEKSFTNIPDSVQTTVYWYWISDNISKEGVVKDLEAMKKVGINRAFIGHQFLEDTPRGKIKLFTPEWWDIIHTALKTATRLNIEIGMFNTPGWSQSGGPWVKPEQSMRYLASSELAVIGPIALSTRLAKPGSDFQDVKVIAYPVSDKYNEDIKSYNPQIAFSPSGKNPGYIMDNNDSTFVRLESGIPYTIDIGTKKPYTARSLIIKPTAEVMKITGEVQIRLDSKIYKTIKRFSVDRSNNQLNVGFNPYADAFITLPEISSDRFRILINSEMKTGGIREIKLSGTPVVEDYIEKTMAKMWQDPFPYWQAYRWNPQPVINNTDAVIDPAKVIDISAYMSVDGVLKWKVPAGNWIIERTGMLPTGVTNAPASPEGRGLETDKMSRKHIFAHFEAFLGEMTRRIPEEDRKTWKVAVQDSYETGGQNWTDGLIEKFHKNFGYDPTSYMPVIHGKVVGSAEKSDRFLWDLRRFIADNVAYEYVAGLRDISHKYGLTTWLENYGHWGFPGEFLQYGGQSDEVAGEFWSETDLGDIENRAASSCAHIYGKTKVSCESFTCAGSPYSRYPALMKQRGDKFFTEGINNTLLHVYVHQPYEDINPGVNAWFGNEFNRKNTWFYDMDIFLKYIKRCNMMLQQGKYVADVAYFISEDAPKMTGTQDPELPKGYSFDYINGEVIKTRLTVKGNKLVLPDGMNYSLLVLPKVTTMRPELLLKIKELVLNGAVIMGPRPEKSPSLQNFAVADKQVASLTKELWGNINGSNIKTNHLGKGMVIDGMGLKEALELIKVRPDVTFTKKDSLLFIHRKLVDGSVYFISNQSSATADFEAAFRVSGKVPELWDPVSGKVRELKSRNQINSQTNVPLKLAPFESAFVIFRKQTTDKESSGKTNYPAPLKSIVLKDPWTVNFEKDKRGPWHPVKFDELQDWTTHANESIKYYSGSALYHNEFQMQEVNKGESVYLDLGMVRSIAKVKVNDVELGGVWTAPYRIDISSAIKNGVNKVEIKVVNTWVNRLIGDSRLPLKDRKTYTYINPYKPDSPLISSGLLGPVKVEVISY